MDNNLEQRLERIEKIALENARKDLKQIKDENDYNTSLKLEEISENYREYLADKYENELKKIDRDYNKEVYDFEIDERIRLKNFKENILKGIKSNIINQITLFVNSNEYKDYLFKNVNLAFNKINADNTILYLTQKDIERYASQIQEIIEIKIEKMDDKYIGGSMLLNKDKKISIDNTLLTSIEEEIKKVNL